MLAIGAGVVGVAGLGVGSAFGLVAMSKRDEAQGVCPHALCSDSAGSSKWSDAKSAGNVATVAFIVGGVGAAAGVVLWLTAPSVGQDVRVGFAPGRVQVRGTW
jgi:serine/threonine-protein kinase